MGSNPSKLGTSGGDGTTGMKRIPSAAFGRLRIDSPSATPGSGRSTLSQRRQQRMQQQQQQQHQPVDLFGGGGVASSEMSPLILSGRHLSTIGSDVSKAGGGNASPSVNDLSYLTTKGSPPLAVWIGPALCCAMAYALYNIFIKKGSSTIHPVLGGVILQIVAALLGTVLLLLLIYTEGGTEDIVVYDAAGIRWAVLAGVAVGCAEIVSFFVSSLGVQAMQSIPIIIGGSVMFGTTIGAIFLKEELSYRGWIGVVMISCGISLVGLDDMGGGD